MNKALAGSNINPYTKRRLVSWIVLLICVIAFIAMGVRLFADRKYNIISMLIAFLACVPFYFAYEKREGSVRRMVLIAVMIAFAVTGRLMFAAVPINPGVSVVILSGIYMGPEAGFIVGSLQALVANIFFGQGPWTPFQMLTVGLTGLLAGLPGMRFLLRKKPPLLVFGAVAGVMYSCIMDIWTAISLDGYFTWKRYVAALGTAVPYMTMYVLSNVVFLFVLAKPVGEKLNRLQVKHGIF